MPKQSKYPITNGYCEICGQLIVDCITEKIICYECVYGEEDCSEFCRCDELEIRDKFEKLQAKIMNLQEEISELCMLSVYHGAANLATPLVEGGESADFLRQYKGII